MTGKKETPRAGVTSSSSGGTDVSVDKSPSTEKIGTALAEKFPAVFTRPSPLKVGVYEDLLAATDIPPAELTAFLASWVADLRYLAKIRAGRPRVDLRGQKVSVVTAQEESFAKLRAMEVFQKRKIR